MIYKNLALRTVFLVFCVLTIGWLSQPVSALTDDAPSTTNSLLEETATTMESQSKPTTSYVVQAGDSLSSIAWRHNVTINQLMAANNIVNPNLIYTGQVLIIPAITIEQEICHLVHLVKPGETLGGIAVQYGVTLTALIEVNRIINTNLIYVGSVLALPPQPACQAEAGNLSPILNGEKRIEVVLSEQLTYLYQGDSLVDVFVVSTGHPGRETAVGTYYVENKIPVAHAYTWGLQMPAWIGWNYWVGTPETGYLQNGFHALPIQADGSRLWEGYLGTPVSYGCVILSQEDADTLYEWVEIGTPVVVWP